MLYQSEEDGEAEYDWVDFPSEYNIHNTLPRSMRINKVLKTEADGNQNGMSVSRKFTKRLKNRAERRKAKLYPDCPPGYGKYRGWLT